VTQVALSELYWECLFLSWEYLGFCFSKFEITPSIVLVHVPIGMLQVGQQHLASKKNITPQPERRQKKALQENCAVILGGLIWCPSRAGIIGFSIKPENSDHVFEFSVRNSRKGNGLTITGIIAKEGYTKEPIDDCEKIKELQDKLVQDHQFINEKLQIPVFKKLKLRPWKLTRKVSQRLYYNRDKEEAYGTHLPYAAGEPIPRQVSFSTGDPFFEPC
jgi:hypothetical protein